MGSWRRLWGHGSSLWGHDWVAMVRIPSASRLKDSKRHPAARSSATCHPKSEHTTVQARRARAPPLGQCRRSMACQKREGGCLYLGGEARQANAQEKPLLVHGFRGESELCLIWKSGLCLIWESGLCLIWESGLCLVSEGSLFPTCADLMRLS